jgi:hypothetical protein
MDEKIEEGKKLKQIIELNKVTFTELVLSIHVRSSNGKIAFEIFKNLKIAT